MTYWPSPTYRPPCSKNRGHTARKKVQLLVFFWIPFKHIMLGNSPASMHLMQYSTLKRFRYQHNLFPRNTHRGWRNAPITRRQPVPFPPGFGLFGAKGKEDDTLSSRRLKLKIKSFLNLWIYAGHHVCISHSNDPLGVEHHLGVGGGGGLGDKQRG